MTREEALKELIDIRDEATAYPEAVCYVTSEDEDALNMAIEVLQAQTDGDLISRQDAVSEIDEWIQMATGNGTDMAIKDFLSFLKERIESLPSAEPKTDEESELRFYYVESIDDYWIGQRLDNFYYADWHDGLGFVWSKSRYLPWGEHIVDENTMWKEHTYPSEPLEIPFTEWIKGFVKKYFAEPKTGKWVDCRRGCNYYANCSNCGMQIDVKEKGGYPNFCENCGADMRGEEE